MASNHAGIHSLLLLETSGLAHNICSMIMERFRYFKDKFKDLDGLLNSWILDAF